jgi:hypothetical protein
MADLKAELKQAKAEAKKAIGTLLRLMGVKAPQARTWAGAWVNIILDDMDPWAEPDDDESGYEMYGDGEDQISTDSAMYRD